MREFPRRQVPAPRRMSDDDLLPFVRDLLRENPDASIGATMKRLGTGRERARTLLERAREEERHERMVRVK